MSNKLRWTIIIFSSVSGLGLIVSLLLPEPVLPVWRVFFVGLTYGIGTYAMLKVLLTIIIEDTIIKSNSLREDSMNIITQKDGSIVFSGVSNESQYSDIAVTAKQHGCKEKTEKYMTVVTISGTAKQMAAFEKAYNS